MLLTRAVTRGGWTRTALGIRISMAWPAGLGPEMHVYPNSMFPYSKDGTLAEACIQQLQCSYGCSPVSARAT